MQDRQECKTYLRDEKLAPNGYQKGWNVLDTTRLTAPVDFYLRGEEYSAQLGAFVSRIQRGEVSGENDFASAAITDEALASIVEDSAGMSRRPQTAEAALKPKPFWRLGRK